MRRTDVFVHEQLGLTPLSVSADRIAHVALRCAVLLTTARAAALGQTLPPTEDDMAAARAEGWIVIPDKRSPRSCRHALERAPRGRRVRAGVPFNSLVSGSHRL
jgi:hypothetical protein